MQKPRAPVELPHSRPDGTPDTWKFLWYSCEVAKEKWPWIFDKGDKPSLVVFTLEALAVLRALKLFYRVTPTTERTRVRVGADNREMQAHDDQVSVQRQTKAIVREEQTAKPTPLSIGCVIHPAPYSLVDAS